MEVVVLPAQSAPEPGPDCETAIRASLAALIAAATRLDATSPGTLLEARSTLLGVLEGATALGREIRGLGPDFTQGDWAPLVERVLQTTTRVHGALLAFLKQARVLSSSPRLLDTVRRAATAVMALREEAMLLAGRAAWSS